MEILVWGVGAARAALVREGEAVPAAELPQAVVAAVEAATGGDWTDAWVVRVRATEEDGDAATRGDPAVLGFAPEGELRARELRQALASYHGDNPWEDVVLRAPGYDAAATEAADPGYRSDVAVLADGYRVVYDGPSGRWVACDPDGREIA